MQLVKAINFISSRDNEKERILHSKGDNIEFMIYDNTDEVIEKIFVSLLNRY